MSSSFLGNLSRLNTATPLVNPQQGSNFLLGTPPAFQQQSRLGPEQQPLYNQVIQAGQQEGAGGAFGDVADYYRRLLSNNQADVDAFAAPDIRRFNQETVPGLAAQFAGFGSGGALNGSGFRNAVLNASTDLGERIAAIRAGLRQQGAQGLQGVGQLGLGDYFQNIFSPRQPGLLEQVLPQLIKSILSYGIGSAGGGLSGTLGGITGSNTGVQQ
jgi:hypothetical protein